MAAVGDDGRTYGQAAEGGFLELVSEPTHYVGVAF